MDSKVKLPIGIEDFVKIRTEGFYYVDKTGLIKELLESRGKVNLFTRPRRFGKSLNMNMLKYFFEYGWDASLFDGLKDLEYGEKTENHAWPYKKSRACAMHTWGNTLSSPSA